MFPKFVHGDHFLEESSLVFVLAWDRHDWRGDVTEESLKAKLRPLSWMMDALHVNQHSKFGGASLAAYDAMEECHLTILRVGGND